MVGVIVVLIVSWGLLYIIEKKDLSVLGFNDPIRRFKEFSFGFVFLFFLNLVTIYTDTIVYDIEWSRNPELNLGLVLDSLWFHFKSAMTEELVFRGAILYIIISKLGPSKGIMVSSVVFGIYHWFTAGVLGHIVPMIYLLIITATMGYVWSYSYHKTKSIFLGFGLHYGINSMSALFSRSPTGEIIWKEISRKDLSSEWINLLYLLSKGLAVPVLTFLFILYFSKKLTD